MSTAAEKAKAAAVIEVFAFVEKCGLTIENLIEVGGEDLKSDQVTIEKVKSVEKSWSLMAKLGVKYVDLEDATSNHPTEPARKRRGRRCSSEVLENKDISTADLAEVNPLKNNNKKDDHLVEVPEKGRWKLKRRLTPVPEGATS